MIKKTIIVVMAIVFIASEVWMTSSIGIGAKENEISEKRTELSGVVKASAAPDIRTIYVKTDGSPITKEKKVAADIVVMDKAGGDAFEDDIVYDTIEQKGTIKVRGNSTAAADKKPFNISFSTAQNVFGMGKAKKWSLLANAFDKSLIRNRLAMEFATELGLMYTSKSTFVDLYINDKYYGNYLLIESVGVGKDRVDIDTENENDILLEKEYDRTEEGQSYLRTARYGIRFAVGEPEGLDVETNHYKQTVSFLNRFERLLEDGDFESLNSFVDIDSFVNFYIVNELFKNVDFNYSSTRFYIKEGKLYAGPLWDLDLSSGNAHPTFYKTYYEKGVSYTGLWCQQFEWFKKLMDIPEFYNMVSKRYKEIQPVISNLISGTEGNSMNGIINTYANSFARNYASISSGGAGWSISKPDSADSISYARYSGWKTYSESVEFLRTWLTNRNEYLKKQFAKEQPPAKKNHAKVVVTESEDDIILNGNVDGTQSMIGSYSWNEDYKWLGYVTFKGQANSEYKYLVLNYSGDISTLRLEFVGNAGKSNEIHSGIYWFKNMAYDCYFVSADRRAIPLVENNSMAVIDLKKSGLDIGKYSSGVHMHVGTSGVSKGSVEITNARLVKSVVIEGNIEEETTAGNSIVPPVTTRPSQKQKPMQIKVKRPGKVKIKYATKKKKAKKAKLMIRKVKDAKGYQVKVCVNRRFKKKNTVTKYSHKTKIVIKKLKKNQKYYVKVRAYTIRNGKKYYGKWSGKKRVSFSKKV